MTGLLELEDFGTAAIPGLSSAFDLAAGQPDGAGPVDPNAFDNGYKMGWDDAYRAEAENQDRIGVELAHNLQDLGFTFHEARVQILRSLQTFLTELTDTFLPSLAQQQTGPLLVEELMEMAKQAVDQPIELRVNPQARPALEPMLNEHAPGAVQLVEEPSLGEGQVDIRAGNLERVFDMNAALAAVTQSVQVMQTNNLRAVGDG